MASSQRPGERVVHQDYIARIRYSNTLPPPANHPKLLDIPGTGLLGGQYTSAAYASKLARDQPMNIEADAELGMPIDLIGVPGVFSDKPDKDAAIMARPGGQPLHPADKALLKPLSALGKGAGGAVSFLRRTEYTSSQGPQHFSSSSPKDLIRLRNDPKRRKTSSNKEDPLNIIRHIVKGFDVAYPEDAYRGEDSTSNIRGAAISDPEVKAWSNPKHPSKPEVTLMDSYPVLPDLEALPEVGAFFVKKFITNPVAAGDNYDERLDVALLQPKSEKNALEKYEQRKAEWTAESGKPAPLPEDDYDLFLPAAPNAVRGIKRKLNVNDPENEDEELYADELANGTRAFKYTRLRTYETYTQSGDPNNFYDDSVALALHDPETDVGPVPGTKERLQKGAYFYPVMQRTALRPKRNVGVAALSQADHDRVDQINMTVAEMTEEMRGRVAERRAELDGSAGVVEVGV
ncbi:uncharacterized protein LTR77_005872 [Saxophila tyrrhenica]|uniref:Paf1-domain-containing protein n=1 Tax=Saxophila tyrrhenica TaxID=1690608 RepID=A0AAV9PCR2_9PEZI|nr:hypothetical protein LTR77_005872 [Saxophila tyrrhenica]